MDSVPSWDEFNVEKDDTAGVKDDEPNIDELSVPVEYGPAPPRDFFCSSQSANDFSIPSGAEYEYAPDDPEDPQPGSSTSKRVIEPIPQLVVNSKNDEQIGLPCINNSIDDFEPRQNNAETQIRPILPPPIIGPALPPSFMIDPALSAEKSESTNQPKTSRANEPAFEDLEDSNISLPPEEPQNIATSRTVKRFSQQTNEKGPALPSSSDEDENEEGEDEDRLFGPMPPPPDQSAEEERDEYLNRLVQFKSENPESLNGLKREEWMLELPDKAPKQKQQIVPKSAFSKSGASSSSVSDIIRDLWTSTPNGVPKTNKKEDLSNIFETQRQLELDKIEEERAKEHNVDRTESLVEIHQRKRRLDEASTSNAPSSDVRRPFSRDTDLQVRGGQTMSTEEAKERLGSLSGRFGHGTARKFL